MSNLQRFGQVDLVLESFDECFKLIHFLIQIGVLFAIPGYLVLNIGYPNISVFGVFKDNLAEGKGNQSVSHPTCRDKRRTGEVPLDGEGDRSHTDEKFVHSTLNPRLLNSVLNITNPLMILATGLDCFGLNVGNSTSNYMTRDLIESYLKTGQIVD